MITVRECTYEDRERYDRLEGEYHYMGESHGAGDTIRLIFEEDGKWVALQTWAAASYALKPRDERIGWNPAMRRLRLKLVVNNRRFCVLAQPGERPNLASQILGMSIRELPSLWQRKWGYPPLLAETFCDIERVSGTCYRAAGWEEVGKTKGFSRSRQARDFYIPNGRPKVLYMKPFRRDAWDLVVSNDLPREYLPATHANADGVLPFPPDMVESLAWELCHVKDPRGRNRSVGIGAILTLYTMGVAAGAKDLKEVHSFAKRLTNAQLKELGCPKAKDKFGEVVDGQYSCPSYNAFYHLLTHRDGAGRHDFDVADYAAHLSKWMTAQAGRLPRHLAVDGKFVKDATGLVSVVDAESGDVVAVSPASKKEGLKGRCELPIVQKTLAAMDLSDAVVSADALSCQHGTAQTILEQGGDYVLQVKSNQPKLAEQCECLSRIRPLADSFKKRAEPGTVGGAHDAGFPHRGRRRARIPRRTHGDPHVSPDMADSEDEGPRQERRSDSQARRRTDEGSRLPRLVARSRLAHGGEVRRTRSDALVRRGLPWQARQRLPRGCIRASLRRESHGGGNGRTVARNVDLRKASRKNDRGGEA